MQCVFREMVGTFGNYTLVNLIEKFTTKNDLTKIRAPMAKFSFGDQSSAKFETQKLISNLFAIALKKVNDIQRIGKMSKLTENLQAEKQISRN